MAHPDHKLFIRAFLVMTLLASSLLLYAKDEEIEFFDSTDADLLEPTAERASATDTSEVDEKDDLETLKEDLSESVFDTEIASEKESAPVESKTNKVTISANGEDKIFDVGDEEKKLLDVVKFIEARVSKKEWNEIASSNNEQKYTVVNGDTLWKISKKLFGSGFYYAKIWALNPQIKNPHNIEPGTTLLFEMGDSDLVPSVKVGNFAEITPLATGQTVAPTQLFSSDDFGDSPPPSWLKERADLIEQGVFFQYASEETYNDLADATKKSSEKDYEKYVPPLSEIVITEPGEQYDSTGFDKTSKISFDTKEGFYLNTFISTNVVKDLGKIDSAIKAGVFIQRFDKLYARFDKNLSIKLGDKFSTYSPEGKVAYKDSDREGYRYTITGQLTVTGKVGDLYECEVTDLAGTLERNDRITVYTPRISRIVKTFSKRAIEAAIVSSYRESNTGLIFGDVVYLDRGRSDGVEMGTVFEVFNNMDTGTDKQIIKDPAYKIGELTVITLTDDFATALITQSSSEINLGAIAYTKTAEAVMRAAKLKASKEGNITAKENAALEELDVEINLDDLTEDLLDKADKVRLTEDELEELERLEREKSILGENEKDLRELTRLEKDLENAENLMNSKKLDEDGYLEEQNLDTIEKRAKGTHPDSFNSLNEIEGETGKKYIKGDLNSKENPYGLTEFDLEEIDELLNIDKKSSK